MNNEPHIVRVRHETIRRRVTVARVEQLAPQIRRVILAGDELRGFNSPGFDDHVKLFFPSPGSAPVMRDFTPRRFDAEALELTIDFFLHEAGPAATWAAQAAPGEMLEIGGPRGSSMISLTGIDAHLFIGDETALPAIGRRLEELSADSHALVVVEAECEGMYPLASRAALQIVWVPKDHTRDHVHTAPGEHLIKTLRTLSLPKGHCFAWAATETQAARAIRRYLTEERGFEKPWVKAAGYWQHGATASHEVIQD